MGLVAMAILARRTGGGEGDHFLAKTMNTGGSPSKGPGVDVFLGGHRGIEVIVVPPFTEIQQMEISNTPPNGTIRKRALHDTAVRSGWQHVLGRCAQWQLKPVQPLGNLYNHGAVQPW